MLHTNRLQVLILLLLAAATTAQPTRENFIAAWDDAATMTLPKGSHAAWTSTITPILGKADAEAELRGISDGDPRRAGLQQAVWLNGRALESKFELWYIGRSQFRINEDTPLSESSPVTDATINEGVGWVYGADGVLTALDMTNVPPMRDPRSFLPSIDLLVSRFLNAGLGSASAANRAMTVTEYESHADSWTAEIADTTGSLAFRLTGSYDTEREQFLTSELTVIRNPLQAAVGNTTKFLEYHFVPFVQRMVPSRVVTHDPVMSTETNLRLVSLEPFEPTEFKRIARLPDAESGDSIRQGLALRRIDDFRPASAVKTEIDPITGAAVNSPLADPRPQRTGGVWRPLGWTLVGVIALFLIVRAVRRSS